MNDITVEDIEYALNPLFPGVQITLANAGTEEEPLMVYYLGNTGGSIQQVEMEVTRHSILGSKTESVTGWQGYVTVTSGGGYMEPPDVDIAPATEPFESLVMAVTAMVGSLVMAAVGDTLSDIVYGRVMQSETDMPF